MSVPGSMRNKCLPMFAARLIFRRRDDLKIFQFLAVRPAVGANVKFILAMIDVVTMFLFARQKDGKVLRWR